MGLADDTLGECYNIYRHHIRLGVLSSVIEGRGVLSTLSRSSMIRQGQFHVHDQSGQYRAPGTLDQNGKE